MPYRAASASSPGVPAVSGHAQWRAEQSATGAFGWSVKEGGRVVALYLREEDARRIAAEHNACAGLDIGGLETGSVADALQALAVLCDDGEPAAARRLALGQGRHALRALGRLTP